MQKGVDMPRVSLTDFVDVVSRVGMQKITKISEIKHREPYTPQTDYWKQLREHIIENHSGGGNKANLLSANQITQNQDKQLNYSAAIKGYRKFWGRKVLLWFQPPTLVWNCNGLDVSLNPELGLNINGNYHVIKLYFKADPLSKAKVDLILFLMHQALPLNIQGAPITYGILDVRRAKHLLPNGFSPKMIAALQGEAQYISTVWPGL
jgi:hypothetical protein